MKKAISILLAAVITFSMTACSDTKKTAENVTDNSQHIAENTNAAESEPQGDEVTEIDFWYSWTDTIEENNLNLTKQFNETVGKEMGIKVNAEYQGTYADLSQKLQAAYVSGTVPAVTVMDLGYITTFADNGVFEPLTPYIERDAVNMDDYYESLLENCKVDGTYYALPYLRSTPVLYLNATLLKEAGLDPSGPKTWDDLAAYCKTIKEKTGTYGLTMYSDEWLFDAFLLQSNASILNEANNTSNINTPESKETLRFFKELIEDGDVACHAGSDSNQIQIDFMSQNAAMFSVSSAYISYVIGLAEQSGFEVNIAPMPMNDTYGVAAGGCNLIMTSSISEKEKEAAWTFIKWMTETDQAAYASAYTGYVPTRKSAVETDTIQKLYAETPQFEIALNQLKAYGSKYPMVNGYTEAADIVVSVLDAVWVNGAEIESTTADAETQINELLQETN
ncbi:ABC transporter substrate-binding protein [Fusibacter paucivorans]|uniref:ABC transporter substrate-binding protein n=1 Tax=Fusibacter paucivorans TaxID=76009 RepID=A0ABS5PPG2_9FIRM|nr:ABC transporter substrate-binding protein [Fusibacter paucivorans]MBS7526931.1 ABC transporter substrate-binding protein [Fusibacter paucivorans]